MHIDIPVSMRSTLNPEWRRESVVDSVFHAAGLVRCTLPPISMPAGDSPHVGNFASIQEFWTRCRLVKRQLEKDLTHPLLTELYAVAQNEVVDQLRGLSKVWRLSDGRRHPAAQTLLEYPPESKLPDDRSYERRLELWRCE